MHEISEAKATGHAWSEEQEAGWWKSGVGWVWGVGGGMRRRAEGVGGREGGAGGRKERRKGGEWMGRGGEVKGGWG